MSPPDAPVRLTEDAAFAALESAFGTTVHGWPVISRERPRWWQRRLWRDEARINEALAVLDLGPVTDAVRRTYWAEVRRGQDFREDAGSYFWRCWAAALVLPHRPAMMTYSGYVASDIDPDQFGNLLRPGASNG